MSGRKADSTRSRSTPPATPSRRSARTNRIRFDTPCSPALATATPSASMDTSVATTSACGHSHASVTARQPDPVPASTMCSALVIGAGWSARAVSTIDSVSGRGVSTSRVTRKERPQNSRAPEDLRDRLAGLAPADERVELRGEAEWGGFVPAGEELSAIPCQHFAGQNLRVDVRRLGGQSRRATAAHVRRRRARRWPCPATGAVTTGSGVVIVAAVGVWSRPSTSPTGSAARRRRSARRGRR